MSLQGHQRPTLILAAVQGTVVQQPVPYHNNMELNNCAQIVETHRCSNILKKK